MSLTSISSPRITVQRAPRRSACFIWPFRDRPACSIWARRPLLRSCPTSTNASRPVPATNTSMPWSCSTAPAARRIRSMPGRPADPRRRRAAELLDQPVVAAAAAERGLGPQPLRLELEHRARVVVEPAHERGIDLVRDAGRVEQGAHLAEVLGVLGARSCRSGAAPPPSPPGCRGDRRRRRAAGSGRAARARPRTARPRAREETQSAPRGSRRAPRACPGSTASACTGPVPASSKISASSRISSASSVGSSEPSASASICVNWRKRPACGASWRKKGPASQTFTGCGSLCMPCSM